MSRELTEAQQARRLARTPAEIGTIAHAWAVTRGGLGKAEICHKTGGRPEPRSSTLVPVSGCKTRQRLQNPPEPGVQQVLVPQRVAAKPAKTAKMPRPMRVVGRGRRQSGSCATSSSGIGAFSVSCAGLGTSCSAAASGSGWSSPSILASILTHIRPSIPLVTA